MKQLMVCLLLLSSLVSKSQQKDHFTLSGKIKNQDFDYIYLRYMGASGSAMLDSAKITNGAFRFDGQLAEPTSASLYGKLKSRGTDDPNFTSVFLEPKPMSISVLAGDFKNAILKGSATQDEQIALNKMKESIRKEKQPFVDAYMKEKDHEKAAAIREQFEPYDAKMDKIDLAYFKAHPDSYLTAYLMRFKMSSLTAAEAKQVYNGWTTRIKQSSYGKYIATEIKKLQNGSPGSIASSFTATDITGLPLSLADFKGKKYVLLDFWASWCVPCRKGNPHLLLLYSKYKDKGLEIIGVSDDDRAPDAWKKAVETDKIGVWKHVLRGLKTTKTGYDMSTDISGPYGIHTLPTKILIDKNGVIIGRYGGGGENDEAMDKKLAEVFAQQEQPFKIKGTATGNLTGKVYLNYTTADGKTIRDSTVIKDGSFTFTGLIPEPTIAWFSGMVKTRSVDDPNSTNIFLEPGEMTIVVAENRFKELTMNGSKSQDEMVALTQLKAPIRKEMEPLSEALRKEKDHEKAAEIRDQFEPYNIRMGKIDDAFIASHPDSYVTAYTMRFKLSNLTAAAAEEIYSKWTSRIKQSSYGKTIREEIDALKSGSPGAKASMFSAKDISGEQLSLADFTGKKYVLLDFWASWCVPCRKGNPHLLSLYSKYKDMGLEIIGVASDDSTPDAWRKAVEQDKIGVWKHVLSGLKRTENGYDKSERISEPYGIHTLPTKILIDKNGVIIGRYGGNGESDEAMDKKIAEIFNK